MVSATAAATSMSIGDRLVGRIEADDGDPDAKHRDGQRSNEGTTKAVRATGYRCPSHDDRRNAR